VVVNLVKPASSILVLLKHGGQEASVESAIGDGKILWSGNTGFDWIGKEDEEWDSALLVEYPSNSELQQSVGRFNEKNFEKTRLFSVRPLIFSLDHLSNSMRTFLPGMIVLKVKFSPQKSNTLGLRGKRGIAPLSWSISWGSMMSQCIRKDSKEGEV